MSKQSHTPLERKQPASRPSLTAMHVFTESLSTPKQTPEPEQKTIQQKTNEVRFVRFLLSPPPEESMSQRPKRETKPREFYPTDPKAEEKGFGSAKVWGRRQLKLLDVKFAPNAKKRLDLNKVLNVDENQWPPAVQQRVEFCVQQLEAVDMEATSGRPNVYEIADLAQNFGGTFDGISALMTRQAAKLQKKTKAAVKQDETAPLSPTKTGDKRPGPASLTDLSTKRRKGERETEDSKEPTTPDQPTMPADPKLSSTTEQSQAESATDKLLYIFVGESIRALGMKFFCGLKWHDSGLIYIQQTGVDYMSFMLGYENVKAINDGGLDIRYDIGQGPTAFRKGGIRRPVLSLEAKRRKSDRRDDPNVEWEHAGQIFAEMLGQVCYKDFYTRDDMEYQEAFVLHARHSSVMIYYCKFPNQYLSDISQFGKKFLTHPNRTFRGKVKLLRTNKYSLRNTGERVAIFKLIAKLLWYLISGESRVGFLYNYPDNPLHDIGKVIHEGIAVEDPPKPVLPATKVGEGGDDSVSSDGVGDEGNDSNESFSASEAGGDVAETGGLESAGEAEDEEGEEEGWEEAEGDPMDLS